MQNQDQIISHGKVGYFGTTTSETLGFVIEAASISETSQKYPFANGVGNTVGVTYGGKEYSGTLSGKMIDSTDADSKRAAFAAGTVLNMPQLAGGVSASGLAICDGTKQDWANTGYASFEISYTVYPYISATSETPAA